MKLMKYLMSFAAAALALTACEVEPADLFSTDPVAPVLDAHADILMTEPTMNELVTFSWSVARNIGAAVTYDLQVACGESLPATLATTGELSYSTPKSTFLAFLEQHFAIPAYQKVPLTVTVKAVADGKEYVSAALGVNVYANSEYLPPVLTAGEETIVLDGNAPSASVELLAWEPAHIGVDEAVTYNVYAMLVPENGEWTLLASDLTGTHYATTAKTLNDALVELGAEAGSQVEVAFQVKAFATSAPDGLASAVVPVLVQTYKAAQAVGAWSLIGNVNGDTSWSVDAYLSPVDNGLWVSDVVSIGGSFKLRFNSAWDANRGGDFAAFGEPFDVVNNGADINVPAGNYYVVYDEVNETITVNELSTGWGLIGDGLAKGWDGDTYKLLEVAPGVFRSGEVKVASGSFKLRLDDGWDVNFGGTFAAYGVPIEAVPGGDNIALPDSDVTVYITLDTNDGTVTVDNAATRFAGRWGVVGMVSGMSWDGDVYMYETGNVWRSVPLRVDGEFKLRYAADWGANRGGSFVAFDTPFAVEADGPNIGLGEENLNKFVYVVYDPATEQVTVNEVK